MAESNGSQMAKQPDPGWFPETYLHGVGRQMHQDYSPRLRRSLSADFRDYIVGTKENTAHEEVRKIQGSRRGKKSHVTRLVNQINQRINQSDQTTVKHQNSRFTELKPRGSCVSVGEN